MEFNLTLLSCRKYDSGDVLFIAEIRKLAIFNKFIGLYLFNAQWSRWYIG